MQSRLLSLLAFCALLASTSAAQAFHILEAPRITRPDMSAAEPTYHVQFAPRVPGATDFEGTAAFAKEILAAEGVTNVTLKWSQEPGAKPNAWVLKVHGVGEPKKVQFREFQFVTSGGIGRLGGLHLIVGVDSPGPDVMKAYAKAIRTLLSSPNLFGNKHSVMRLERDMFNGNKSFFWIYAVTIVNSELPEGILK